LGGAAAEGGQRLFAQLLLTGAQAAAHCQYVAPRRTLDVAITLPSPVALAPVDALSHHDIARELVAVACQRQAESAAAAEALATSVLPMSPSRLSHRNALSADAPAADSAVQGTLLLQPYHGVSALSSAREIEAALEDALPLDADGDAVAGDLEVTRCGGVTVSLSTKIAPASQAAAEVSLAAPGTASGEVTVRLVLRLPDGLELKTLAYALPRTRSKSLAGVPTEGPAPAVSAMTLLRRLLACPVPAAADAAAVDKEAAVASTVQSLLSEIAVGAPSTAASAQAVTATVARAVRAYCRTWPHAHLTPAQSQARVQDLVLKLRDMQAFDANPPEPPLAQTRIGSAHVSASFVTRELPRLMALTTQDAFARDAEATRSSTHAMTPVKASAVGSARKHVLSTGRKASKAARLLGAGASMSPLAGVLGASTGAGLRFGGTRMGRPSLSHGPAAPFSSPIILRSNEKGKAPVCFTIGWNESKSGCSSLVASSPILSGAGMRKAMAGYSAQRTADNDADVPVTPGTAARLSKAVSAFAETTGTFLDQGIMSPVPSRPMIDGKLDDHAPAALHAMKVRRQQEAFQSQSRFDFPQVLNAKDEPLCPFSLVLARYTSGLDMTRSHAVPASFNREDHQLTLQYMQSGIDSMVQQRRLEEEHMRNATGVRPSKNPRGGYMYHLVSNGAEVSPHAYERVYLQEVYFGQGYINDATTLAWQEEAKVKEAERLALTPARREKEDARKRQAKENKVSWWDQNVDEDYMEAAEVAGRPQSATALPSVASVSVGDLLRGSVRAVMQKAAEFDREKAAVAAQEAELVRSVAALKIQSGHEAASRAEARMMQAMAAASAQMMAVSVAQDAVVIAEAVPSALSAESVRSVVSSAVESIVASLGGMAAASHEDGGMARQSLWDAIFEATSRFAFELSAEKPAVAAPVQSAFPAEAMVDTEGDCCLGSAHFSLSEGGAFCVSAENALESLGGAGIIDGMTLVRGIPSSADRSAKGMVVDILRDAVLSYHEAQSIELEGDVEFEGEHEEDDEEEEDAGASDSHSNEIDVIVRSALQPRLSFDDEDFDMETADQHHSDMGAGMFRGITMQVVGENGMPVAANLASEGAPAGLHAEALAEAGLFAVVQDPLTSEARYFDLADDGALGSMVRYAQSAATPGAASRRKSTSVGEDAHAPVSPGDVCMIADEDEEDNAKVDDDEAVADDGHNELGLFDNAEVLAVAAAVEAVAPCDALSAVEAGEEVLPTPILAALAHVDPVGTASSRGSSVCPRTPSRSGASPAMRATNALTPASSTRRAPAAVDGLSPIAAVHMDLPIPARIGPFSPSRRSSAAAVAAAASGLLSGRLSRPGSERRSPLHVGLPIGAAGAVTPSRLCMSLAPVTQEAKVLFPTEAASAAVAATSAVASFSAKATAVLEALSAEHAEADKAEAETPAIVPRVRSQIVVSAAVAGLGEVDQDATPPVSPTSGVSARPAPRPLLF
jgi:hypothetical protein